MAKLVIEGISFKSSRDNPEHSLDLSYSSTDNLLKTFAPKAYKTHNLRTMHQGFHRMKINNPGLINRKVAVDVANEIESNYHKITPDGSWEREHVERFVKIMRSPKSYQS